MAIHKAIVSKIDPAFAAALAGVDRKIKTIFEKTVRRKLSERIAKARSGEDKRFSTFIDGRPSRLDKVRTARSNVRFQFGAAAIRLAINILQQEMRKALGEAGVVSRSGLLHQSIHLFHGQPGKALKSVTDVPDFQPGDVVLCGYMPYYAAEVNRKMTARSRRRRSVSRKRKGIGFLGTAANRIRGAIGQGRRGNQIVVKAIFSKALESYITGGKKLVGRGVPAIVVEYRKNISSSEV